MPVPSNKKKNRPDLFVFIAFAAAGLLFAIGLEIIDPGVGVGFYDRAIHLATPAVVAGLVGLMMSPRLIKKSRTSVFGYILFAIAGLGAALLILGIFENDTNFNITLKSYYLASWFGVFFGFSLRFAIDEAIYRKETHEDRK